MLYKVIAAAMVVASASAFNAPMSAVSRSAVAPAAAANAPARTGRLVMEEVEDKVR
jgi:L-asparagine transporter-like permease